MYTVTKFEVTIASGFEGLRKGGECSWLGFSSKSSWSARGGSKTGYRQTGY